MDIMHVRALDLYLDIVGSQVGWILPSWYGYLRTTAGAGWRTARSRKVRVLALRMIF